MGELSDGGLRAAGGLSVIGWLGSSVSTIGSSLGSVDSSL